MKIKDLAADSDTSAITQRVVQLLNYGYSHGFNKITLTNEEFISVYKGKKYKLHHADVGLAKLDPSKYKHHASLKVDYESGQKQWKETVNF